MRTLLVTVALVVAALATGCAHAPRPADADAGLFHDAAFGPPTERVSTDDVSALNDAIRCVRLYPREIEQGTVLAMYADNRAAEALAGQRLDDAHAWAREALRHDAAFASAWNTLGVACLRRGEAGYAAAVFEHALAVANSSTRREHDLYAAKHAWLGSASRP